MLTYFLINSSNRPGIDDVEYNFYLINERQLTEHCKGVVLHVLLIIVIMIIQLLHRVYKLLKKIIIIIFMIVIYRNICQNYRYQSWHVSCLESYFTSLHVNETLWFIKMAIFFAENRTYGLCCVHLGRCSFLGTLTITMSTLLRTVGIHRFSNRHRSESDIALVSCIFSCLIISSVIFLNTF